MSTSNRFGSLRAQRIDTAKPFLKWAGGKGQLLKKFVDLYPEELENGKIETYVEAFVGSGAVFFELFQNYNIEKAVIIDTNKDLIVCYNVIKDNVSELVKSLSDLQEQYWKLEESSKKDFYNKKRDEFNNLRSDFDYSKSNDNWVLCATLMIFLNKTCFNGLYRVNSKGGFNVPIGSQNKPTICNEKNLVAVSKILKNVEIVNGDFTSCEKYASENTFVYFDPPYRPLSQSSSFNSYSDTGFNDDEQKRLANFFDKMGKTNTKLMLSNSDPKNTDPEDNFFDELYSKHKIVRVPAVRAINSKGEGRGEITEIVVRNY